MGLYHYKENKLSYVLRKLKLELIKNDILDEYKYIRSATLFMFFFLTSCSTQRMMMFLSIWEQGRIVRGSCGHSTRLAGRVRGGLPWPGHPLLQQRGLCGAWWRSWFYLGMLSLDATLSSFIWQKILLKQLRKARVNVIIISASNNFSAQLLISVSLLITTKVVFDHFFNRIIHCYWKCNAWGFRPPLYAYRLRRTSWGWCDEWDDTALQTQDAKFEPWRFEAEHGTSQSRRLSTILKIYEWAGKMHQSGVRTRYLRLSKQAALTTAAGPPPFTVIGNEIYV